MNNTVSYSFLQSDGIRVCTISSYVTNVLLDAVTFPSLYNAGKREDTLSLTAEFL